jgi:hypothetical protein
MKKLLANVLDQELRLATKIGPIGQTRVLESQFTTATSTRHTRSSPLKEAKKHHDKSKHGEWNDTIPKTEHALAYGKHFWKSDFDGK